MLILRCPHCGYTADAGAFECWVLGQGVVPHRCPDCPYRGPMEDTADDEWIFEDDESCHANE